MKVEHLHNLTDKEFIRTYQFTDDPILTEAIERLIVALVKYDDLYSDINHESN